MDVGLPRVDQIVDPTDKLQAIVAKLAADASHAVQLASDELKHVIMSAAGPAATASAKLLKVEATKVFRWYAYTRSNKDVEAAKQFARSKGPPSPSFVAWVDNTLFGPNAI